MSSVGGSTAIELLSAVPATHGTQQEVGGKRKRGKMSDDEKRRNVRMRQVGSCLRCRLYRMKVRMTCLVGRGGGLG